MLKTGADTLTAGDDATQRGRGAAHVAQLYVAMECDRPLAPPTRHGLAQIDTVLVGRGSRRAAERTGSTRTLAVRVPDPWMSSNHFKIAYGFGRYTLQDAGSRNGTLVDGVPATQPIVLEDGALVEAGHTLFLFRHDVRVTPDDPLDFDPSERPFAAPGLETVVPTLARELALVPQLAASPVSIILQAESGTGKELVARAVHALSARSGPFVPINCGAIPETLVETELFGYRKGAFSGANEDRSGVIRAADRGTLFLDEIGDLPASSQAAFLRVLQEREVVPVGSTRAVPVDVRLVAATHRDLEQLVEKGSFRADLLARMAGYTLRLPPLRDRKEDLALIAAALLKRIAKAEAARVTFTPAAARALFRHPWPLNIRELEKVLETAIVLARHQPIDLPHLPDAFRSPAGAARAAARPPSSDDEPEDEDTREARPLTPEDHARRAELVALLEAHGGNVSAVARAMGKARMQIQRWIKRYAIDPRAPR